MTYKVVLTKQAINDLDKLVETTRNRIAAKLKEYSQDPFQYARKLSSASIGTYRFRIGDYRVVFDIDNDKIVVLRAGHRKDIYK